MTADKLTKILLNIVITLGVILIIIAVFKSIDKPKPRTEIFILKENPAYIITLENNHILVKDPITLEVIYSEPDNNVSPLSKAIWKDTR